MHNHVEMPGTLKVYDSISGILTRPQIQRKDNSRSIELCKKAAGSLDRESLTGTGSGRRRARSETLVPGSPTMV